jgi:hypothetical protein
VHFVTKISSYFWNLHKNTYFLIPNIAYFEKKISPTWTAGSIDAGTIKGAVLAKRGKNGAKFHKKSTNPFCNPKLLDHLQIYKIYQKSTHPTVEPRQWLRAQNRICIKMMRANNTDIDEGATEYLASYPVSGF